MRLERAIDRFLDQMRVERDWTPRTLDSYRRILNTLADDNPDSQLAEFDGRPGTEKLRATIAARWGTASAGTRANRISTFRSFFAWAEDEDLVDDSPARRIRRPPRRRADVYRPPRVDRDLARNVTTLDERPAWILMDDLGLRASTVVRVRWRDVDLTHGRIHVRVKGGHRDVLPIPAWALTELRELYRLLQPDQDDHVFAPERELEQGRHGRRRVREPRREAKTKALWTMTRRVCERAGVRPFGPHALRHGYATSFLRESRRDIVSLKALMRHASVQTTEQYADDLSLEELEGVLDELAERRRTSVADSDNQPPSSALGGAKVRSGPGRNRTSGPAASGERTGGKRADEADEAELDPPKGGHK